MSPLSSRQQAFSLPPLEFQQRNPTFVGMCRQFEVPVKNNPRLNSDKFNSSTVVLPGTVVLSTNEIVREDTETGCWVLDTGYSILQVHSTM
jgi:hypothetical protein